MVVHPEANQTANTVLEGQTGSIQPVLKVFCQELDATVTFIPSFTIYFFLFRPIYFYPWCADISQ